MDRGWLGMTDRVCSVTMAPKVAIECVDDCRVELGSGVAFEFGERVGLGSGVLVAALGGHGVKGVADSNDARAERNIRAGEPVGISVAVPAFVAGADEDGDRRERRRRR